MGSARSVPLEIFQIKSVGNACQRHVSHFRLLIQRENASSALTITILHLEAENASLINATKEASSRPTATVCYVINHKNQMKPAPNAFHQTPAQIHFLSKNQIKLVKYVAKITILMNIVGIAIKCKEHAIHTK